MTIPHYDLENEALLHFLYHSESTYKAIGLTREYKTDYRSACEIIVIDSRENYSIPLDRSDFTFWEILSFAPLSYKDRDAICIEVRIKDDEKSPFVRTTLYVMQVMARLRYGI